MERLGHCGGEALALEGGERGREDGVGATEFAQEFASHASAKAGSERERQPAYVIAACIERETRGEPTQPRDSRQVGDYTETVPRLVHRCLP
jgi:hypothetical protein